MKNTRAFIVTYLGATNTLPSRMKIRDERNRKTVHVSTTNLKSETTYGQAQEFLAGKGIKISYMAESRHGFILLTNDFKTQIK